ncbi:MAG: bifunctional folylpolyglutamate synthase/dihydrofolate synthase [Bacteroidales bacterium]|jgi:dihydrofolate synthase/folylpolyglutamate synthase|nr:bifunctional folylpolyglutamate synthase/dihydrofolate synthase [Bacteroidales bacterium]
MTYRETIDYLFSTLPMYQRVGATAYKSNLDNTIALMSALGNPERAFKSIHVAGTNGKGSTSHLLASILTQKKLKTGLHTSPHLKDFRERIRIDGMLCKESFVVDFIDKNKSIIEQIKPSFFELSVAMAFKYFEQEKVDIAVIEVGMGGRLDSTNVISPLLSVITNISFDHTQFLGNTLSDIAKEKAGIIKHGIPVVIGQTQKEVQNVFIQKAKEENSKITFADCKYNVRNVRNGKRLIMDIYNNDALKYKDLELTLCGNYQQKNILGVLACIDELNEQGFNIDENVLRYGILNIDKNARLLGRWQKLKEKPLIICDTGHNEDGLRFVISQLQNLHYSKLHIVFGVVNDKDLSRIFPLLPVNAEYYLCKADIPRGLPVEKLAEKFKQASVFSTYSTYNSVNEALNAAIFKAKDEDVIFVGGSTFVVAEVI